MPFIYLKKAQSVETDDDKTPIGASHQAQPFHFINSESSANGRKQIKPFLKHVKQQLADQCLRTEPGSDNK